MTTDNGHPQDVTENLLQEPSEWTEWNGGWRLGFISHQHGQPSSDQGPGIRGISAIEIKRGQPMFTGRYLSGATYFVVKGEVRGFYSDTYDDARNGEGSAVDFCLAAGDRIDIPPPEKFVACWAKKATRLTIIHTGGLQFVGSEIVD